MDRSRIGIIIPAFNERDTIGEMVSQCLVYGNVIVVDDGSVDDTADVARARGADVVSHAVNRGYDAALESGFGEAAESGYEYAVTIDADGQHDPEILSEVLELLDRGADVVVGIRNKHQRLAEHFFSCLTNLLYGIYDPLCGLKGYTILLYGRQGYFDSYRSIGTELMLFAARNHFRVEQFPILIRDRQGKPRFGQRLSANYKILRAMSLAIIRSWSRKQR